MISIIIPSYNNANYLDRCLNSIVLQTNTNYEAIVVDDGSTDNTAEICKKYSDKYANIKVIKKENEGVSIARNTGLKYAKGEYIIFVDSDDYLEKNALKTIENKIEENVDIYIYNNLIIKDDGISECKNSDSFSSINSLILETVEATENNRNEWLRTIWAKVYIKDILKKTQFPKEVHIGEDACFLIDLLYEIGDIKRIKISSEAWYVCDRTNELSATHKYKRDMYLLSKLQFDHFMKVISKLENIDERYRNTVICKFCWRIFWILYFQGQNKKNDDSCFKWYEYTKKYINESNIYKIDLNNKLLNITFKFRYLLSYDIPKALIEWYYLKHVNKEIA